MAVAVTCRDEPSAAVKLKVSLYTVRLLMRVLVGTLLPSLPRVTCPYFSS